MTAPDAAKQLANIAARLADLSDEVARIADDVGQGHQTPEDEAVRALTPAGQTLVRYLAGRGGTARYSKILEDFELEPARLGGILGGIKRRKQPQLPAVVQYESAPNEQGEWDVFIEPLFMNAARALR